MPIEHANRGKPPRDASIPLGIRWANGMTARHTYTADKLRWTITGSDFDVGHFWRIDGKGE
jgi:hypothetical protein